mmetsp:Transcript_10834/g.24570  ORF Transcript_10834/g.24570 Transcript_10834/m.24570 type:complete len:232 (+) Transcript_10834:1292-1987(+)
MSPGGAALADELRRPAVVGPLQILLDAGRRLEGDLERLLQQNGRELGVHLRGQPEAEGGGRLEGVQLLLQRRQPGDDKVHVLEREPLAVGGALPQQRQSSLRLALAHGELVVVRGRHHALRELLQLGRRVGARGGDEQDGGGRHRLLRRQARQVEWRRVDRPQSQDLADKVLQCSLESVWSQSLDHKDTLEGAGAGHGLGREVGLARAALHPPRPGIAVGEVERCGQRREH